MKHSLLLTSLSYRHHLNMYLPTIELHYGNLFLLIEIYRQYLINDSLPLLNDIPMLSCDVIGLFPPLIIMREMHI